MSATLDTHIRRLRGLLPMVIGCGLLAAVLMSMVSFALPRVYSSVVIIDAGTRGDNRAIDIDAINANLNQGGWRAAVTNLRAGSVQKVWVAFSRPHATLRVDAADPQTAQAAAGRIAQLAVAAYNTLPPFRDDQPQTVLISDPAMDELSKRLIAAAAAIRERGNELRVKVAALEAQKRSDERRIKEALQSLRTLPDKGDLAQLAGRTRSLAREIEMLMNQISSGPGEASRLGQEIAGYDNTAAALEAAASGPYTQASVQALRSLSSALDLSSVDRIIPALARVQSVLAREAGKATVNATPVVIAKAPTLPTAHSWPNRLLSAAIAFIFGAAAGLFLALLRERQRVTEAAN